MMMINIKVTNIIVVIVTIVVVIIPVVIVIAIIDHHYSQRYSPSALTNRTTPSPTVLCSNTNIKKMLKMKIMKMIITTDTHYHHYYCTCLLIGIYPPSYQSAHSSY